MSTDFRNVDQILRLPDISPPNNERLLVFTEYDSEDFLIFLGYDVKKQSLRELGKVKCGL
jgi:hypothetical protein